MKTTYSRRHFLCLAAASPALTADMGLAATRKRHVINLKIQRRQVMTERQTIRISEGDEVLINWTTDEALELHLHGYNIHVIATPDHPVSMSFRAHTAGRFPIAAHIFPHPILTHLENFPQ
jgi:hypothetical protein